MCMRVCVCVCCTYFWRAPCSPSAVVAALVPVPVLTPAPVPVPYLVAAAFLLRSVPTVPLRIKMSSHKSSTNYIIIVLYCYCSCSLVFFRRLGAPCLSALATGQAYHRRAVVIGQATWACLQSKYHRLTSIIFCVLLLSTPDSLRTATVTTVTVTVTLSVTAPYTWPTYITSR